MSTPKPVVLCILDGFGIREERENNAVKLANTPTFDRLIATCPHATLKTDGRSVGLPDGQMGNSEVGHTNIGAGRVVAMDLGMIDLSIEDGEFETRKALVEFIATMKKSGGTAHLMGLTSPGGVHSHQDHIVAAAKALTAAGVPVAVHAITDGRDVPPKSARAQVAKFEPRFAGSIPLLALRQEAFLFDLPGRPAVATPAELGQEPEVGAGMNAPMVVEEERLRPAVELPVIDLLRVARDVDPPPPEGRAEADGSSAFGPASNPPPKPPGV